MLSREVLGAYTRYADTFQHIEHQLAAAMLIQVATVQKLFDTIASSYIHQAWLAGGSALIGGGFSVAGGVAATTDKYKQFAEALAGGGRVVQQLSEVVKLPMVAKQTTAMGERDLAIQHGLAKTTEDKRKFGEEDNKIADSVGSLIHKDYESYSMRV